MGIYAVLVVILSFFLTSIITGAETALNNYPRSKIKKIFKRLDKKKNYALCSSLLHASILLVRTLGYILVISLTTVLIMKMGNAFAYGFWKMLFIAFILLMILIFAGQIFPSILAVKSPEKYVNRFFILIKFSYIFFKPLSAVFVLIGKSLAPEGSIGVYSSFITEKELIDVIDAGEREGTIEKEEKIMLHSVIEFGDKIVREVMIPRIEIVCIEENLEMEEVLKVCEEEGFSRIPVYKDNVDNIVGILYTRDLLKICKACDEEKRTIKEIIHDPFFVPETKLISDLFREFKKKKIHMAVVVDEYGGTAGLITLEDLIEEIVGEIQDEYDTDEEKPIKRVSPGIFIVQAKTPVDEINKNLDLNLEESDDFDTMGGFIIGQMGKIPKDGDMLKYPGLEITVLEADERSVKRIKIRKNFKETESHGQQ